MAIHRNVDKVKSEISETELDSRFQAGRHAVYSQKAQAVMRQPIVSKFGVLLTYRFESCICDI